MATRIWVVVMTFDSHDMKTVLDCFYQQCREACHLGNSITVQAPIRAIVVAGMGGSALPGDILTCYLRESRLPVFVNRDYALPAWVTHNTLVFVISYSGNTEETVKMLADAKKRGCKIVVITGGGKLREIAREEKLPWIQIPQGIQPRDATGFMTIPILRILERSGVIGLNNEIEATLDALRKDHSRQGEIIAKKLVGKIPMIYSSQAMYCLARVWKIKINENAKVQAFWNTFPEVNHNEMVGFTNPCGDYYFLFIEDLEDGRQIRKRMSVMKSMLESKGYPVLMIRLSGKSRMARLFSAILLGSFVGYHLALLGRTDPTPVEMVEEFKTRLKEIRSGAFF